jgi:hypothetical protein
MTQRNERKFGRPPNRDLIVAYLSYALEDVRALSDVGFNFLYMTIAFVNDEPQTENAEQPAQATRRH